MARTPSLRLQEPAGLDGKRWKLHGPDEGWCGGSLAWDVSWTRLCQQQLERRKQEIAEAGEQSREHSGACMSIPALVGLVQSVFWATHVARRPRQAALRRLSPPTAQTSPRARGRVRSAGAGSTISMLSIPARGAREERRSVESATFCSKS